ncbi:MAG TPA: undecaprenyl-diphosphate phosphatase, partial [Rubrobacter sp.]|nr:undecaprenyl-diphosphate phosphatase [Rubrobacter sp.]
MLELVQAILLGVVQGLTEFLPVSSSGHLLLGQYFLGMDQDRFGLTFDASIHTGTVLAVVVYFWRDLMRMAAAFVASLKGPDFADRDQRMAYLILVACIPAGVVGLLFQNFFEEEVRSPWLVAFNLVLVGALFIVGEVVGRQTRTSDKL